MKLTRRAFIKGVASAGALVCASRWVGVRHAFSNGDKSLIFKVEECPMDIPVSDTTVNRVPSAEKCGVSLGCQI